MQFMRTHGTIDSLNMRHYKDKATNSNMFKGSVNVIFKNEDDCKKFLALDCVKYNDNVLQTMSQEAFVTEKKAEFEARKEKKNKKTHKDEKVEAKLEFPSKSVVKLAGNTIAEKLVWDDIKEKVKDVSGLELAHVNFKPGQVEGHLRFRGENEGETFCGKLTDGAFTVGEFEFKANLLNDEEEKEYYQEWNKERFARKHKPKQFGKKRKGNFKKDNSRAKKHAHD